MKTRTLLRKIKQLLFDGFDARSVASAISVVTFDDGEQVALSRDSSPSLAIALSACALVCLC